MKKEIDTSYLNNILKRLMNCEAYDMLAEKELRKIFISMKEKESKLLKEIDNWKKEALAADKLMKSIKSYKTDDDGPYYEWVNSKLHRNGVDS